jgi:phytol kinase
MTVAEWLATAIFLSGLLCTVFIVRCIACRFRFSSEGSRKSVHVIMGIGCCLLPWVFERPLPVWILAALATIPILALRFVPAVRSVFGNILHGISRPSYGEVLFAPAVASVFHLSGGDVILYLIPVLILTLADAAGAMAGTRWGRHIYSAGDGFKSIEGSSCFLLVAFASILVPLLWAGSADLSHAFWIALILATLAMMAEGFSDRGFDNMILPLGSFLVLNQIIGLEIAPLIGRFITLALLLALVLTGSRWSSLSGAALLGSAMLGYGCAVLADWRYALPPSALFICRLFTTRKRGLMKIFTHRLDVVISHGIACLPWVLAASMDSIPRDVGLVGISLAMAAQLAQLDHATRRDIDFAIQPLRSVGKGFIIAAFPGILWMIPTALPIAVPVGIAIAATFLALPFSTLTSRHLRASHESTFWYLKGALSLTSSIPALLLLR